MRKRLGGTSVGAHTKQPLIAPQHNGVSASPARTVSRETQLRDCCCRTADKWYALQDVGWSEVFDVSDGPSIRIEKRKSDQSSLTASNRDRIEVPTPSDINAPGRRVRDRAIRGNRQ